MLMNNALKQEVLDLVDAADDEQLELVKDALTPGPGRSRLSSLSPEEIAKLNAAIEQSDHEIAEGKMYSLEEVLNNPNIF